MKEYDYDRQQEPATFSKGLSDLILTQQNPAELIALYWFYYYTAKWQQTNQPKATNKYAAKALHWSYSRVGKVSQQLSNLNLIKRIIAKNNGGKVIGHYIKVYFIWEKPCLRKTMLKENHGMVNFNINALNNNNIKENFFMDDKLVNKSSNQYTQFDPTDLPIKLANNSSIQKAWNEYVQHRKELKKPITTLAYKKIINKILLFSEQEIIQAINRSIENHWTGIFP